MTPQTDSTIAGLPAEVIADLARDALHGASDTSEAAFETLQLVAGESNKASAPPTGLEAAYTTTIEVVSTGFVAAVDSAQALFASLGPGQTLILAGLSAAFLVLLRARPWRRTAEAGHGSTPHRRAYAQAVTNAAQLLANGEELSVVSRTSGLARDVVKVVGSRRLVPAAPSGGYAASEASSGRNTRGGRATPAGRVLK